MHCGGTLGHSGDCKLNEIKNKGDVINHPKHYNSGKIECIEYIEDQQLGFHLGNAVKYISRAGKKDPNKTIEDLEKAIWYIRRHIEVERSKLQNRPTVRPNDMPQERLAASIQNLNGTQEHPMIVKDDDKREVSRAN